MDDPFADPDVRATRYPSRRSFLRKVGTKVVYVTPLVLSLAAREARAGSGFHSTCGDAGSPCTLSTDCCTGLSCMLMVPLPFTCG